MTVSIINSMNPNAGSSNGLPTAIANDILIANAGGEFTSTPVTTIIDGATQRTQGYYGLLSNYYFDGGVPTQTTIDETNVNTWVEVNLDIDALGTFDNRPLPMSEAQAIGHTGAGTTLDPITFKLEGLTQHSSCNFRASMSFEPEIDEGQLETRLLFNRHSGTTPSADFSIEEVSLTMSQGADIEYPAEPLLTFFVGDTIDTNAVGDAGQCRFQIKSSVEGLVRLRALTWYVNT